MAQAEWLNWQLWAAGRTSDSAASPTGDKQ